MRLLLGLCVLNSLLLTLWARSDSIADLNSLNDLLRNLLLIVVLFLPYRLKLELTLMFIQCMLQIMYSYFNVYLRIMHQSQFCHHRIV